MSRMRRYESSHKRKRHLSNRTARPSLPFGRRLRTERLEDRLMLTAVTITNDLDLVNGDTSSVANLIADDGGDGIALREAIVASNNDGGGHTLDFDATLDGDTILLSLGQMDVTNSLILDASSLASGVIVDAGGNSRIFDIDDGSAAAIDVELRGLTLTGGAEFFTTGNGGAIRSTETLTITNSVITGNSAFLTEVASGPMASQRSLAARFLITQWTLRMAAAYPSAVTSRSVTARSVATLPQ